MSIALKFCFFILLIFFLSCAAIGPAKGGPKDTIGPILVSVFPENATKNLDSKQKIEILFSEYIDPNSVKASVKINTNSIYEIIPKKNMISIIPLKLWDENNNLRISVSRNIRDINGNNMESPIELIYSFNSKLNQNNIFGTLYNFASDKIYNIGLFEIIEDDSLYLQYKTQSNYNGEFEFKYLNDKKYTLIASDGNIENIQKNISFNNFGVCNLDYIEFSKSDSISIEIYIDKPLQYNQIKSGKLLSNNHGQIQYTSGKIDKFYFSEEDLNTFPNHIKITQTGEDSISIISHLKNRIEEYQTNKFSILKQTIIDTTSPKLLSTKYNDQNFHLSFDEPIVINTELKDDAIYCYDVDSNKINIEPVFDSQFDIKIINKINSNEIYLPPGIFSDLSNNLFPDSTKILIINTKSSIDEKDNNNIFGKLKGFVSNFNQEVIVEAKNIELDSIFYVKTTNKKFFFENLLPGNYILRSYEIQNNLDENIYFPGKINPYRRAAKFTIYNDMVDIRARWEVEGVNIKFNEK